MLWIIDGLPSSSHYANALRNDPEQIEAQKEFLIGDEIEEGDGWHPNGDTWSDLYEMIAIIAEAVVNQNNDGKSEMWRMPRPTSLLEDMREQYRSEAAFDAFADFGFDLGI